MTDEALARFVDRFTIEFVREYPHPIERVWRATSDPAELALWFWAAEFSLEVGAPYAFGGDESDFKGVITAIEPPALLRFGGPMPHGPSAYIEFRLAATLAGTRLTFVQHSEPGFWRKPEWPIDPPELMEGLGLPWRPGTLSGWHSALDCLGDLLDKLDRKEMRAAEQRALTKIYREHMRSMPLE